jgi:hypothetical protein
MNFCSASIRRGEVTLWVTTLSLVGVTGLQPGTLRSDTICLYRDREGFKSRIRGKTITYGH